MDALRLLADFYINARWGFFRRSSSLVRGTKWQETKGCFRAKLERSGLSHLVAQCSSDIGWEVLPVCFFRKNQIMPKSSRFRHQKWHKGTRCTRHKRGSSWPCWRTSCWNTYPSQNILSTPVAQGLVETLTPGYWEESWFPPYVFGKFNPFSIRIQTAHFLVVQNHPSELSP